MENNVKKQTLDIFLLYPKTVVDIKRHFHVKRLWLFPLALAFFH